MMEDEPGRSYALVAVRMATVASARRRGGQRPTDTVSQQRQPFNRLIAEHEPDVTIGDIPYRPRTR
jgi:hypothetical protein